MGESSAVIDTNILINSILEDVIKLSFEESDLNYEFEGLKAEERIIPIHTITEFSTVMQKIIPERLKIKGTRKHTDLIRLVSEFIRHLPEVTTIHSPDIDDINRAIVIYEAVIQNNYKERSLDFADILSIAIARNKGYRLLTNDKKMLRLYNQLPKEWYQE